MNKNNIATKEVVLVDGENLLLEDVLAVARGAAPVALHPSGREKLLKSRAIVEDILTQERVVYGVTTGFGRFSDVLIPREDSGALQNNIIMSHACGVGDPLPQEVVRAMMLLRANSLAKGYSGVRLEVVMLLWRC